MDRYTAYDQQKPPRQLSPFAALALVFSLFSIFPPIALASIICAIIAYLQIWRGHGAVRGTGFATVGLIIAVVFVLSAWQGRPNEDPTHNGMCTSNQKQIALAVQMYMQEHEDTLPGTPGVRTSWRDHGTTSIDQSDMIYRCPYAKSSHSASDYGYNDYLLGAKAATVTQPETMVLTADSNLGTTLQSQADIALRHRRHGTKAYIASFLDGHVEAVPGARAARLR